MLNTVLATFSEGAPPIPASSFESIASATGTGSSATITFSSIPSTYASLQIRALSLGDSATYTTTLDLTFNSDTGSNYSWHFLLGDGSSAGAGGSANANNVFLLGANMGTSAGANIGAANIIDIIDYASTTKNKTVRYFCGADGNVGGGVCYLTLGSGLWRNTTAITSITLTANQNFTTATRFSLYGIKG